MYPMHLCQVCWWVGWMDADSQLSIHSFIHPSIHPSPHSPTSSAPSMSHLAILRSPHSMLPNLKRSQDR